MPSFNISCFTDLVLLFRSLLVIIIVIVMSKLKIVVALALLGLVGSSPLAGKGLKGSGYPLNDDFFHNQDEETHELCDTLRRHMDVLLRSKIFRCERLNLQEDEAGKQGEYS